MRKRLHLLLTLLCLLNLILLGTISFSGRSVGAATKKTYKAEIVVTDATTIQATLDQRAVEGWQFVAASGHAGSTRDVIVLIFENRYDG